MSYYAMNCRCKVCDISHGDAPFGASFENAFSHRKFCCNCGSSDGWYDSKEKWIPLSVWWKPWTWFDGRWEKAE